MYRMYYMQALPGTATNTVYSQDSDQAKIRQKSVLMKIILDLAPFSFVNKPGELYSMRVMDPNFSPCSDKFYRDLLDKVGVSHIKMALTYLQ